MPKTASPALKANAPLETGLGSGIFLAMLHDHEPWLVTDPALQGVLDELIRREPLFHREEFGRTRADFENLITADFWEIGASGRRYSREYVLSELEKRYTGEYVDVWETSDFGCRQLADRIYLLTYTLVQNNDRRTRRTTIWERTEAGWKARFHQGTIVQDS